MDTIILMLALLLATAVFVFVQTFEVSAHFGVTLIRREPTPPRRQFDYRDFCNEHAPEWECPYDHPDWRRVSDPSGHVFVDGH